MHSKFSGVVCHDDEYIYMMIHGHKFINQQSFNRIYSVDTKSKSDNNKLAQSFLVKKNCQNIK